MTDYNEGHSVDECREHYNKFYSTTAYPRRQLRIQAPVFESLCEKNGWKDKKIIDLGCGWGITSVLLAAGGNEVTAVDFSLVGIERARNLNPGPHYVCADVLEWTPSIRYDGAFIRDFSPLRYSPSSPHPFGLEHKNVLRTIFKLLRPGSKIAFSIMEEGVDVSAWVNIFEELDAPILYCDNGWFSDNDESPTPWSTPTFGMIVQSPMAETVKTHKSAQSMSYDYKSQWSYNPSKTKI